MVTHIPSPHLNFAGFSIPINPGRPASNFNPQSRAPSSENGLMSSQRHSSSRPHPPPSPSYAPSSYSASHETSRGNRRTSPQRSRSVVSRASTSAARETGPPPSQSHRRHHRSSQSDAGVNSRDTYSLPPGQPQNSFPWFNDTGDVEIITSDRRRRVMRRYLLHHIILAQNSVWWERELARTGGSVQCQGNTAHVSEVNTERNQAQRGRGSELRRIREDRSRSASRSHLAASSTVGGTVANDSSKRRWRYELVWGEIPRDGEDLSAAAMPVLVQTDPFAPLLHQEEDSAPQPTVRNKPPAPQASFFRNLTANFSSTHVTRRPSISEDPGISTAEDDVLTAHDNMFRIFYNHAPILDATNIATAYVQCKVLLSLGILFGAQTIVGPRVEHHLLHFRSHLWKQIAKYPASYLKLGHVARSKAIFTEALVHVVGQWPAASQQLQRGSIDNAVNDLIEDKVDELEEAKARIECKLLRLNLTTSRGERVTPVNSWFDWLAVSLFRQWIAENTTQAPSGILKDSPSSKRRGESHAPDPTPKIGRVYRLLEAGGQAYLSHDEVKCFLKLQPSGYNRDTMRKFERRLEELKHLAADAVRPVTRNSLELDLSSFGDSGWPYLTCVKLDPRDFDYIWGK